MSVLEKAKEDKVTIILAEAINGGGLGRKILSYDVFRSIAKRILSALEAEKPAEDAESERAFSMLSVYGVTKERAKTVSNGIDVLATRYRKDRNGFEGEKQSFAESYHAKECAKCDIKNAMTFNKCTRLDNPCFTRNGIYCTNKTQCHR